MAKAHSEYVTKGNSDHSRVKEYFNVLAPPIFVIPLDQVKYYTEVIYSHSPYFKSANRSASLGFI